MNSQFVGLEAVEEEGAEQLDGKEEDEREEGVGGGEGGEWHQDGGEPYATDRTDSKLNAAVKVSPSREDNKRKIVETKSRISRSLI